MEKGTTGRGFPLVKLKDRYNRECSLQISSLADDRCVWFGIDKAEHRVMAIDADKHGIKVDEKVGWVDYPIHEDVCINTRMHLNMDQVKELLPYLIKFTETGEIY